jgi:hypothetical protein
MRNRNFFNKIGFNDNQWSRRTDYEKKLRVKNLEIMSHRSELAYYYNTKINKKKMSILSSKAKQNCLLLPRNAKWRKQFSARKCCKKIRIPLAICVHTAYMHLNLRSQLKKQSQLSFSLPLMESTFANIVSLYHYRIYYICYFNYWLFLSIDLVYNESLS